MTLCQLGRKSSLPPSLVSTSSVSKSLGIVFRSHNSITFLNTREELFLHISPAFLASAPRVRVGWHLVHDRVEGFSDPPSLTAKLERGGGFLGRNAGDGAAQKPLS